MNYRELSHQEMFDIVWNGAKSKKFVRSSDDDGACWFRDPNNKGNRCAAGWFIPPDYDLTDRNGMSASELSFFSENFTDAQIDILTTFQMAHDNAVDAEDYEIGLRSYARHHRLNIPK